jgi:GNAT superfamily N-acetyltransferase
MLTKGKKEDLLELDKLAVLVINDMKKSLIPQWELSYPRFNDFEKDVLSNSIYLYKMNGIIVGTCTVKPEDDPAYKTIDSWMKNNSLVIHRMLVHPEFRNAGIAKAFIDNAISLCKSGKYESIKIDTHLENYKMRNFLTKNGFIELEYITVMDRLAFELLLEGKE